LAADGLRIRESPVGGSVPLYEVPAWRERYGVVAGITGRGEPDGRGFDLGLWSDAPIGDTMGRWRAFRRALSGFNAVVVGNQSHGVEVMSLDAGVGWIQVEGIDGWTSVSPGILLTVTVADCVPVYLVVPGRAVAMLHAGWRGTAGGILGRGVSRLAGVTETSPDQIVMHCGVAICGACYEVGAEVMAECGVPTQGPGPFHLDLRSRLAAEGKAIGIGTITTSEWCSSHDRDRFYSHRGSRGADGRMVAYLGMPRTD
jgi:copper oxidase (laccase) domain-containing protein